MATAVAQKGPMNDILRRHEADIRALLRIVTGFLFLWHGMEKIFGFPEAPPAGAPAFILWAALTVVTHARAAASVGTRACRRVVERFIKSLANGRWRDRETYTSGWGGLTDRA